MTRAEYEACCDGLEKLSGRKDRLKKERSACLKLMQKMGVDTSDWNRVNDFCRHPRIMGKEFAMIRLDEFPGLTRKLRAIMRKDGVKPEVKRAKVIRLEVVKVDGEA